jgi:hypothetical protein
MPRFRVVIEGSGIELPGDFAGVPGHTVRGFFVARVVIASDRKQAGERVLALVADDWRNGPYASLRAKPSLKISEVHPASFLEWLRPRRTGYAFHPGE